MKFQIGNFKYQIKSKFTPTFKTAIHTNNPNESSRGVYISINETLHTITKEFQAYNTHLIA